MIVEALARYWAKVERRADNECWPWKGAATAGGYGQLGDGSRRRARPQRSLATHIALAIDGRARPSLAHVAMHLCDNPRCVNPRHLRWGTNAENMADMIAKGRSAAQVAASAAMDRKAVEVRAVGSRRKLDAEAVRRIRSSPLSAVKLAREMGVSHSLVSAVRGGTAYCDVD